jgi:hypothetical protein
MSYPIRQIILDHLAGNGPLSAVVESGSTFDYAELPLLGPTLRAKGLGDVADGLDHILEHLPHDEISWRRVFLVRDDDGGVILATKLAGSRRDEPRIVVCCLPREEGVLVKGGDGVVAWWRQYLKHEMQAEELFAAN